MRTPKNKHGWITVACAFVLQGLTHGLASSMGVFYIQWENSFPSSSTLISALATSVLATILCTAPIGGAIARKAGIRLSLAFGGALSFAGFCLTSFVYKASLLFITVAGMIGFGSSVVYMASVIVVSDHFTKNFATASGVANAGASAGVLVLPLLFGILVSTYDWRGACLVVAAIELHVFVCMIIIKSPPENKERNKPSEIPPTSDGNTGGGECERIDAAGVKSRLRDGSDDMGLKETACCNDKEKESQCTESTGAASSDLGEGTNKCICGSAGINATNDENDVSIRIEDTQSTKAFVSDHDETIAAQDERSVKTETGSIALEMTGTSVQTAPPMVNDSPFQGDKKVPKKERTFHRWFLDTIHSYFLYTLDLFNIRLLWTNAPFTGLVVSFHLGGWMLGTILPHLAARAINAGIDKLLASSLISIIGAGNIVSRCTYGRLVDAGIVHPVYLMSFSYAITAFSSAVVAFSTIYSLLCIGAFGIGIGSGIYIPLMQPLVRSLVGPKDFSGGFGLCLLSVGIGNFISATCAGLIYDLTNNYTLVFLLPTGIGTLAFLTALINQLVWGTWRKQPNWPIRTTCEAPAEEVIQDGVRDGDHRSDDDGNHDVSRAA